MVASRMLSFGSHAPNVAALRVFDGPCVELA